MKFFRAIFIILIFSTLSFSSNLIDKNLNDKSLSINKGSYKIIEFDKLIKHIKVNDQEVIKVDFIDDSIKPLQSIKIYAKNIGFGNILITFIDSSTMHINLNIVEDLTTIVNIAKSISPELDIKRANGKVILSGHVKDKKEKNNILNLFKTAGIDLEKDLVDLIKLSNPDKMIRLKLYAVEINNTKGLDLKNNWFVSSKNYMESINEDGTYYNVPVSNGSTGGTSSSSTYDNLTNTTTSDTTSTYNSSLNSDFMDANAQRNTLLNGAIDGIMANAVSLTGGLTGAANYLGKWFNVGLTLNYLSSKGVANILDETTLLTLENQDAQFLAGGTIYLKIATTTNLGVPTTEVRNINYGLQLNIKAQNIVNDNYINLNIDTKSTQIDWANTVDNIPSFTEKSILTNVVAANNSTIVLGGLIRNSDSENVDKIPLLGDIPILGKLFTSKSFKEGKSELVFFITPEIVDPKNNNQAELFNTKTEFVRKMDLNEKKEETKKVQSKSDINSNTKEITHEQRMKEYLGY